MTDEELDFFLQTPRRIGHLATVSSDGSPRVGPVWFAWQRPEMLVVTLRTTARVSHISRDPRVSISIDGDTFPPTGAMIVGTASILPVDRDSLTRIVTRYLPPDVAETYIQRYLADPDRVLLRIVASRAYGWLGSKRKV